MRCDMLIPGDIGANHKGTVEECDSMAYMEESELINHTMHRVFRKNFSFKLEKLFQVISIQVDIPHVIK